MSDEMVRVLLEKGDIVKINGIPLELERDTVVLANKANTPLIKPDSLNSSIGVAD